MAEPLRALPPGVAPAGPVEVEALATLRRVWPAELLPISPFALFAAASIAAAESDFGRGWRGPAATSHNWGAIHCREAPPCPPGCVEVDDSRPGETYRACLRVYASHDEGAEHFLGVLLANPERRAALGRGFSALDVARAMRRTGYYEGACPGETPGSGACHDAAERIYAGNMLARAARIARVTGEPDALARAPGQAAPGVLVVLGVGALALGAAWWLSRRA